MRAMREGRSPKGRPYWPTFPYMTYTHMDDADLHALWVYLSAQPAVDTPNRRHQVRYPYGLPGLLGLWRSMAFEQGPLPSDPTRDATWHRGRYLVRAVSYCDQCHTPRNGLGLMVERHDMANCSAGRRRPPARSSTATPEGGSPGPQRRRTLGWVRVDVRSCECVGLLAASSEDGRDVLTPSAGFRATRASARPPFTSFRGVLGFFDSGCLRDQTWEARCITAFNTARGASAPRRRPTRASRR